MYFIDWRLKNILYLLRFLSAYEVAKWYVSCAPHQRGLQTLQIYTKEVLAAGRAGHEKHFLFEKPCVMSFYVYSKK